MVHRPQEEGLNWRYAAALVLAAAFAIEFYRAATQVLTVDEARIYLVFIRRNPPVFLREYEAGHHILHTYLTLLVSRLLGGSELVLRIPSLAACAAYLLFVYYFLWGKPGTRQGLLAAISRPAALAATVLLVCNPLILDHLVLARGYGSALALFAWGFYATLHNRLTAAGILLGLSIAANLTFLPPVCALILITTGIYLWRREPLLSLINNYLGPAFVTFVVLVMLPLRYAGRSNYYFGSAVLFESIRDLTEDVFARGAWRGRTLDIGFYLAVLAAFVVLFAVVRPLLKRRLPALPLLYSAGPLLIGVAVLITAHLAARVPYPFGRTGLWIVFLLELSTVVAASAFVHNRAAAAAFVAMCLFIACIRIPQIDPRYFQEWRQQARLRIMMEIVRARQLGDGSPFRVDTDPDFTWSANYYAVRLKMKNMQPVSLDQPSRGANYYLLEHSNSHYISDFNLRTIYEDKLCDCALAVP